MVPDWVMMFPSRPSLRCPRRIWFLQRERNARPAVFTVSVPYVAETYAAATHQPEDQALLPEIWRVFRDAHYKDHTLQALLRVLLAY